MSPESFDVLLRHVEPHISNENMRFRESVPASTRLAVSLRYLGSVESQQSLSWSFRLGRTTVSKIVRKTCEAIWKVLSQIYLRSPSTEQEWKQICNNFEEMWNLPHWIGAIDGKHIEIECPKKSGSKYFNYKGFFSLVLLAICDVKHCFTFVDIGQYGSGNDSEVLKPSHMGKCFEGNSLNVPEGSKIPGTDVELPYFLVGDEIFPLKIWLMRPYPGTLDKTQRIYNYRVSRARRTIENVFGILAARWRIFRKAIRADIKTVKAIVQACVCLHNFLQLTAKSVYSRIYRFRNGRWVYLSR